MIDDIILTNLSTNGSIAMHRGSGPYVIDEIDWDSPAVSMSTYRVPFQVGSTLSGVTVGTRKPSIIGYVIADLSDVNVLGMTMTEYYAEQLRQIEEAKAVLNKLINVYQDLRIEADGYYLIGRPTMPVKYSTKEGENNDVLCQFEIEMECYDPLFLGESKTVALASAEPMFHFPAIFPYDGNLAVPYEQGIVTDTGDISTSGVTPRHYATDYILVEGKENLYYNMCDGVRDAVGLPYLRVAKYDEDRTFISRVLRLPPDVPKISKLDISDAQYIRLSFPLGTGIKVFVDDDRDTGVVFGQILNRKTMEVMNNGDADVGCEIKITAIAGVSNPRIYNVGTNEFIEFENITMEAGDIITINTNIGEQQAVWHDSSENKDISIVGNLKDGSTFFKIAPGSGLYAYSVPEGYENNVEIMISYTEKYFNLTRM